MEYYEEVEQEVLLIPGLPKEKAEVRRLFDWFEFKFNKEVSNPLIDNKIIKSFLRNSQPSSDIIRNSLTNLKIHLSYLEWITEKRKWLAGNNISVADLSAAAHLSVIDYMGYIDCFSRIELQLQSRHEIDRIPFPCFSTCRGRFSRSPSRARTGPRAISSRTGRITGKAFSMKITSAHL